MCIQVLRAALTNDHSLGGLKPELYSQGSRGRESASKAFTGWLFLEGTRESPGPGSCQLRAVLGLWARLQSLLCRPGAPPHV